MANYNTAWATYELRNEGLSFYVNKELATKRALSQVMCETDDFDCENFVWSDVGEAMGYWTHKKTGCMRWVESIRIHTGD